METKENKATVNRPKGNRVIDAPHLCIDIPAFVDQITNEKAWEKNDRNGITVFKSEKLTMVITALQEGAKIEDNVVEGFLVMQVLGGRIRITEEDKTSDMHEHQVTVFHPGITHTAEALSDVILLLTTHKTD